MGVDGHTHLTLAMIHFMVAAVTKTAMLTGPVQSMANIGQVERHERKGGILPESAG
jgi:hypothetical protein